MKINYPIVSRILIALLFVVAGIQKITGFEGTSGYIGSLVGIQNPSIAMILTVLVILIEVPVALAYAFGYKVCYTGGILAVFTFITIILAHRDFSMAMNVTMALKNLAIIGGILATTGVCSCQRCQVLNPKTV